ncbi:hypothetical protein DVH05_007343 [Phytophthora capsici]|nr:hypothetical protein DVH05_007343 [Phytophthora capsici]
MAFAPSPEQERVHLALAAPIHKGKSSDAFIEFVLGMEQFCWHPGVLSRAYDLQFGSRGLSITHFRRMGTMERYRMATSSASLNSDFSVPPPPAPAPQSWSGLGAAARSFAAYAQATCDSMSVRLAITLVDFIAEVEGGGQLVEEDLPVLVWWINDGLEKYRNAVARDIDSGGNSRIALIDRFSASNPELQGLVLSVLRERLLDGARSQPKTVSAKPRLQERFQAERKISKDVIECIPTRDGKEVCLHFLSKRGCSSKNPSVCTFRDRLHFWPSEIPSKVRVYIEEKLGGLRVKGSRA